MPPLTVKSSTHNRLELTFDGRVHAATYTQAKHVKDASKRLGLPVDFIDDALAGFRRDGTAEVDFQPAQVPPDVFRVRELHQADATAKLYDTFADALKHRKATRDHVITWKDATQAAALDWDWHGMTPPPDDVLRFAYLATPRPSYAWVTRSGGLRMIYERQDDTPANSLAAVAAYSLYQRLQPSGLELKTDTRFPPGEYETLTGTFDLSIVRAVFDESSYDVAQRDEYLVAQGVILGQRLPHDRCPINPAHVSNSPSPVLICEDGIKCFSCAGRGRSFVSWSQMLGQSVPTELATCVKSLTHWDHARYVVGEHVNLPDTLLQPFYHAALTVTHGADDARIPSVFRERDLVRFAGSWGTCNGELRRDDRLKATLSNLPVVRQPDGTLDAELHERFMDSASLDRWGYYPIKRVYGFALTQFMNVPERRPKMHVVNPLNAPEYLEPGVKRLAEDIAWDVIADAYPGVNRGFIELLVFCRGMLEYGTNNLPLFAIEGASGSGKTGSLHLAAAIVGDRCSDVRPNERAERTLSQTFDAIRERGTFVSISEVAKAAAAAKQTTRNYCDFLLHLTPETRVHLLYKGSVRFGDMCVLGVSDIDLGEEFRSDTQLARRAYYHHAGQEFNRWAEANRAAGFSEWNAIRSVESCRQAADSLLSHWVDRYWVNTPPPTIADVARAMGIKLMSEREDSAERTALMRQLFHEWVNYPGASGAYAKRQRHGFKAFRVDPDKYVIAGVWVQLHDTGNPTIWTRANERSWQVALDRELPTRLEVRSVYNDRETWVQLSFQELKGDVWTPVNASADGSPGDGLT